MKAFVKIPVLPERMFSSFLDFRNSFHCMESGLHEIAVISNRDVPAFLEINSRILWLIMVNATGNNREKLETHDDHLLPRSFSEGLSPPHFSRVSLHPNAGIRDRNPARINECPSYLKFLWHLHVG